MLRILCLLAILGLGQCLDPLANEAEIEASINRTIEEVEKKLQADPTLPKLSRRETVDILRNITSDELTQEYKKSLDNTRDMYPRALMVVLPYSSNGAEENLKDLYTRAPVIQMIPDSIKSNQNKKGEFVPHNPSRGTSSNLKSLSTTNAPENHLTTRKYKNHRDKVKSSFISEPSSEINISTKPEKFSFDLEKIIKIPTSKPSHNQRFIPSKTSTNFTNNTTRSNTYEFSKSTQQILKSNQWNYLGLHSTTPRSSYGYPSRSVFLPTIQTYLEDSVTVAKSNHKPHNFSATNQTVTRNDSIGKIGNQKQYISVQSLLKKHSIDKTENKKQDDPFVPVSMSRKKNSTERTGNQKHENSFVSIQALPAKNIVVTRGNEKQGDQSDEFTTVRLRESDVLTHQTKKMQQTPLFETPMSETRPKLVHTLYSASKKPPMRKEVKDLLELIGLRPMEKVEDKTRESNLDMQAVETRYRIPDTNILIHGQNSALTTANVGSTSIVDQNTFENSDPNFQKGVNNLTPSIQVLFEKFGLQDNLNQISTTTTTTTTIRSLLPDINSYKSFKSLPNSPVKEKEMREFLTQFGLIETSSRKSPQSKTIQGQESASVIEVVPGNMKKVLENVGLITRNRERNVIVQGRAKIIQSTTAAPKLHIFKPHETSVFNDQQKAKINELLETVKKVQRGKADVIEVQRVADEVLKTTKSLPDGPNPAGLEEILKLYKEDLKNEVKRQQPAEYQEKGGDAGEEKKSEDGDKRVPDEGLVSASQELVPSAVSTTTAKTTGDIEKEEEGSEKGEKDNKKDSSSSNNSKSNFFENFNLETYLKSQGESDTKSSSSSNNTNLKALEDSFGGTTAKPDPVLPTEKRTGIYFLVDWNTFLEVGEDGKEKVNLRFRPKVGDRSRFIKVTVP